MEVSDPRDLPLPFLQLNKQGLTETQNVDLNRPLAHRYLGHRLFVELVLPLRQHPPRICLESLLAPLILPELVLCLAHRQFAALVVPLQQHLCPICLESLLAPLVLQEPALCLQCHSHQICLLDALLNIMAHLDLVLR